MKNILKAGLLILSLGFFATSCDTDPCSKDPNCGSGTCTGGADGKTKTCVCDDCFEKDANGLCTVAKDCGAFGTCAGNTCACDAGYELDTAGKCETLVRAKYLGQWSVADVCSSSGTSSYTTTVTAGAAVTDVNISNFWGTFANAVVATVSSNGTISIARQQPDNDNYFVVGSGTISGTTINFSYTITQEDGAGNVLATDACNNVTWTKL